MSNAGSIRAGKTFVEITADDSKFQAAVKRVHNRMAALSQTLRQTGTSLALGGAAIGLPMVLAAKKAAEFENALLELKGSVSDLSPKQLKAVREESIRMSKAMGVAPAKIAQSFALLVKAGMSVEEAMNGAARSAVEFGRVSGVEAQQAATFMKVAMNVFGVSAEQAVDTLSAAADASETDIAHMVEAFGLVGSAGKTFDQSLFGVAQGFAALARYGIQGEEAGTGIKVLLSRLVAPSQEAEKALGKLGLTVASFRDADGKLLPMVQIVGLLSDAMKNMSTDARQAIMADKALVDVFGDRGIKVIGAFADMGVQGFGRLATEMESQRRVAEKFQIMMEGISGSFERMQSAIERLAVAFGAGLSPSLVVASHAIAVVVDLLSWLLNGIPVLSPILATLTATAVGLGVAMVSVGWALTAVNFGIRGFLKAGPAFAAVASVMSRAAVGLTDSLTALRAAFFALPLVGQIAAVLAGGTALAAGAWWMMSGGGKPKNAEPKKAGGIKRDEFRKALEEPSARAEQKAARGDTLATFADSIAGQLGIGPKLNAEAKIADATGRTADGVEQLVAMGRNDGSDTAERSPPAGRPQVAERPTKTSRQVVIDRQPPVESQAVAAVPREAVATQKEQRPPVAKRAEAATSVEVAVAAPPQPAMPEPAPQPEPVVQVVANEPKPKPVQQSPAQPSVEALVPPQPPAIVQVDAQPRMPAQREPRPEPATLPVFARNEQLNSNPPAAPIAPAPQMAVVERAEPATAQFKEPTAPAAPVMQAVSAASPEQSGPIPRPDHGNVGPLQMAERFAERPRPQPSASSQLPPSTTMSLGLDFSKIVDSTRRTADGVERLVAPPQTAADKTRSVPSAASLASGLVRPSPVVGGVTASLERDLVSVAERTAIATEKAVGILREILNTQPSGGVAFA
jgi:TP901 family phage tail tape measure protein